MLCIKNRWLVGLCLGLGLWQPSAGLAQQPIRIGATTALTGEASIQGGYVREGYLLCQKHANEKGGVLGRRIEFVIYDDASNGKTAAGLYEKLIAKDKVDAVLGPYGSGITEAVADVNGGGDPAGRPCPECDHQRGKRASEKQGAGVGLSRDLSDQPRRLLRSSKQSPGSEA